MKKILIIMFSIFCLSALFQSNKIYAQSVQGNIYQYDDSGNRKARTIDDVYLKRGVDTVEVKTIISDYNVSIFPNPTQGLLNIKISNFTKDVSAKMVLTDLAGKSNFTMDFTQSDNILDLSKYTAGVYLITISVNGKSQTWKLIKE